MRNPAPLTKYNSDELEKFSNTLSYFLIYGVLLISSLVTILISLSWVFSYEEIQNWHQAKTSDFRRFGEVSEATFTYSRYIFSRGISIVSGILCLIAYTVSYRHHSFLRFYSESISKEIVILSSQFFRIFLELNKKEKWGLFLITLSIIGFQIRNYFYFPIYNDDLASYFYFAEKGILNTALFYPYPNNHIFYNILSSVASNFINDPLLSTRLISFISFLLLLLIIFAFLYRTYSNRWIAYLAIGFCGFFFASGIYGVQGRGYMLFTLFAVFSSFCTLLFTKRNGVGLPALIIVSSVLGAYTIPAFLIPFIGTIAAFIVFSYQKREIQYLKTAFVIVLFVGIGVFLLYLPTVLFSGLESIVDNKFVASDSRNNFYTHIYPIGSAEILSITAGTNTKGWLIFSLLAVSALPLIRKGEDRVWSWFVILICVFGAIFLYNLASRSFMPLRVITYASIYVYISYAMILSFWIEHLKIKHIVYIVVIAITPLLGWWQYKNTVYLNYLFPNSLHVFLDKFYEDTSSTRKTYFSNELVYLHWYFQYRCKQGECPWKLAEDMATSEVVFLTSNNETLTQKGYLLMRVVRDIPYGPNYYIYERNP